MDRSEWLKDMREKAEALYDFGAHHYWSSWGIEVSETHRLYMQKFLQRVKPEGRILSAACGAGRFDGFLLDAGHPVLGIDQSAGVLAVARQHFPLERYPPLGGFPGLSYEKLAMQEMAFHEEFAGVICMDAMEHISPEDWLPIARNFQRALMPGGVLYVTVDWAEPEEMQASLQRARARGLPAVYGEVVDQTDADYAKAMSGGEITDAAVYHFHPPLEQVIAWLMEAGLAVVEVATGEEYHHILAEKKPG